MFHSRFSNCFLHHLFTPKGGIVLAIYHLSAQVISRSDGRSAVAAAAYRAGEELLDERLGQVHNFKKKQVFARHIMAPTDAPEWVYNRQKLWNAVEFSEKRKDAQLCREIEISLPKELNKEQQEALYKTYVQEQFVDRGMVADLGVHLNDPGNPHVHIMLTTREITSEGFGKKNRDWNDKALLQSWREQWSAHANRALEKAGFDDRIDHRSFVDQGIEDRLPTIHEGPISRAMENRGVETERGNINRQIQDYNAQVLYLEKYRKEKEVLKRKLSLQPSERKAVSQAEKIMDRPADLKDIQDKIVTLSEKYSQLSIQEKQLHENLKPFELGDIYFKNINQWEKTLQESSSIKSLFNKESRESRRFLEQRISETKQKLYDLGFKDPDKYEARKLKVTEYTHKQIADIQHSKEQITTARDALRQAEQVIKEQDVQKVVRMYPEWDGAKHLTYEEAKVLLDLNQEAGRVVQPEEIEQAYNKWNRTRNEDEISTGGASRDSGQSSSSGQSYEFNPSGKDPGLSMLKAAFEAAQRANQAVERHEAEKEWQNRKRKKGRNDR
ncbi:MobQ family relaxase [Paenibacillus polymyxa]